MRLAMIVCFCLLLVGCAGCGGCGGSKKKEEQPQSQRFSLGGTAPTKPADLDATPTTTTVALTWSASTDADGIQSYEVFDNGRAKRFLGPLGAFYTQTGLTCGKPHTFAVRARDPSGNISRPAVVHTATSACVTAAAVYVADDGDDGTCERDEPTLPCDTLQGAFDQAEPGDGVQVGCGTYLEAKLSFTTRNAEAANVVFFPEDRDCVTIQGMDFTNGGDYVTLQGFDIVDPDGCLSQNGSTVVHGVVFQDNNCNVGERVDHMDVVLHIIEGWQIVDNTIGPSCCGTGTDSPEGLRIGTPTGTNSSNVLISGNHVHSTIRQCTYWPSGFGSCPSTDCGGCHGDGIHIWGLTDSTISNNEVEDVEVQGIFLEQSNESLNANIDITGNTVSVVGGNAGIYLKANGSNSTSGTWNITGNATGTSLMELGAGWAGAVAGTILNVNHNTGVLFITDSGGNNAGCTGYPGTVTINYGFNTWTPGQGTTGCG